ncbi:MAG: diguanylate cyclase [Actinomycetota bacterium]
MITAFGALGLWFAVVSPDGGGLDPRRVALLAVAFLIAETMQVDARFHTARWTYGFGEVPLAIGLVVATPAELLVAYLVGYAVALIAVKRVAATKVVFNLATTGLAAVIAISLVELLHGGGDRLASDAWPVIMLSVIAATAVSAALVALVIRATEPGAPRDKLVRSSAYSLLIAASNSAVALSAAVVVETEPVAAAFLLIPTIALFVSYRSYVNEHAQREAIESLYSSSLSLSRRRGADDSLVQLLSQVSSMFFASVVEATVRSSDGDGVVQVSVLGGQVHTTVLADVSPSDVERFGGPVPAEPVIVSAREPAPRLVPILGHHNVSEAMVGRLEVGDDLIGVLLVAGPTGRSRSFTRAELRLFGTLLHHASAALENGRLEGAIEKMREIERRLAHEALHDPLTGLANRTRFSRELAAVTSGDDAGHALALVDLDDFKQVNDLLGHAAGDQVLIEVAARLRASLRSTDIAARLGGDEFAVLFAPGVEPVRAAERMLGEISLPLEVHGRPVDIGASVGVVKVAGQSDSERLLRVADAAMYAAKAAGKGAVTELDDEIDLRTSDPVADGEALDAAVRSGALDLHFQPVIDLRTGEVVAVEALARWEVDGDLRDAGHFLPGLAANGMVHEMDRRLTAPLHRALQAVDGRGRPLRVTRNLSIASVRDDHLIAEVLTGLDAADRSRLTIGVPLHELGGRATAIEVVERVRAHGVRIALDAIGSGPDLPVIRPGLVDELKVDVGLLDRRLESVVAYAHALGAVVAAVGLESDGHVELARRFGCDRAQGRAFGSPMPMDDLRRHLRSASLA